jgi:DNA-binding MarR family transcriptional regulator
MTLVEFIAPLSKNKQQDRILAILYYEERYEGKAALTVEQIRQGLKTARVKGWSKVNVADVISKSGHLVDTSGLEGNKRLWHLTDSGRAYVRELLSLPKSDIEVEHDIGTLQATVSKIQNTDTRIYLEEGLKCLQVGALRACVVFIWVAAIRIIQEKLIAWYLTTINPAIKKHDPKARDIRRLDDFAYIKDSLTLLAAKELGVIDKGQKDTLEEALNLRNRCGHPSKYVPGIKKVSAFIEDLVSIVFS